MKPSPWRAAGALLLAATAAVWAQRGETERILAGLADHPLNPVLLRELKTAIPGEADPAARGRLGVLYVLGCLASGNTPEGLAARDALARAFPNEALLQELADDRIQIPCRACRASGTIQDPCAACGGSGKCPVCKGTRIQRLPGLGGEPREVTCMHCTAKPGACKTCQGLGGFPKPCPACAGTGRLPSAEKASLLYRRLLRALAPTKPPEPVILVVTATPPAAVAPDPETVALEWVERALAAAARQVDSVSLLRQYPFPAKSVQALRDPELTGDARAAALAAIRDKGLRHPTRGHYFFVPFPAGLRYAIADAKPNRYGGCFLKLTATPPTRPPPAEPLTPRAALSETARRLAGSLGDFLSDPTVCAPDLDAATARLRKGESLVSGDWLVPVVLDAWGGISREGACYRSSEEALRLLGFTP